LGAPDELALVPLADKVRNARSILRDLRKNEIGAAVWSRCKASKEESRAGIVSVRTHFIDCCPGNFQTSWAILSGR
jgi:hypothetical protein